MKNALDILEELEAEAEAKEARMSEADKRGEVLLSRKLRREIIPQVLVPCDCNYEEESFIKDFFRFVIANDPHSSEKKYYLINYCNGYYH